MTSSKPPRTGGSARKPTKPAKHQWPSKLDVEAARRAMNRLRLRAKRAVPKR